jgi:DNA-binding winged helix-turn-helix (wHTH) protein
MEGHAPIDDAPGAALASADDLFGQGGAAAPLERRLRALSQVAALMEASCHELARVMRLDVQRRSAADMPAERAPRSFLFGAFVLIPERQLLLNRDAPVRIGSRSLDILVALVERAGELVCKRELFARVWPDTFVEEGNLKVNVAALRRALGEAPGQSQYIATVPGRGYRFVAPVHVGVSCGPAVTAPAARTLGRLTRPADADEIHGVRDLSDRIVDALCVLAQVRWLMGRSASETGRAAEDATAPLAQPGAARSTAE